MEYKKNDMYLRMEKGRSAGWTTRAVPVPPHVPGPPAKPPDPMPMPTPPVVETPETCGYMVLAMAYLPMQEWKEPYEAEEGFKRGTIFEDLDLPFMGKGDC